MSGGTDHWEGDATLFDGESARPRTIHVRIAASGITFTVDGQSFTAPREAVIVRERHARESARIALPQYPEGVLLLDDAGAIGTLDVLDYPLGGRSRATASSTRKLAGVFAALLLLLVLSFTWGVDRIVDVGVRLVPEGVEAELGQTVYRALIDDQRIVRTLEMQQALATCTDIVQSFGARGADRVVITVVDDESVVNAFALPGGRIVLYRGILARIDSEDELFGLLAHELGHVHYRHGLRHVARKAVLGFVFATIFGEASGVSAILIDNGAVLVDLAYGRSEEQAADEFALDALHAAGFDPRGLVSLFEKLEETHAARLPEILSTHPAPSSRIDALEAKISTLPEASKTRRAVFSDTEWEQLTGR